MLWIFYENLFSYYVSAQDGATTKSEPMSFAPCRVSSIGMLCAFAGYSVSILKTIFVKLLWKMRGPSRSKTQEPFVASLNIKENSFTFSTYIELLLCDKYLCWMHCVRAFSRWSDHTSFSLFQNTSLLLDKSKPKSFVSVPAYHNKKTNCSSFYLGKTILNLFPLLPLSPFMNEHMKKISCSSLSFWKTNLVYEEDSYVCVCWIKKYVFFNCLCVCNPCNFYLCWRFLHLNFFK